KRLLCGGTNTGSTSGTIPGRDCLGRGGSHQARLRRGFLRVRRSTDRTEYAIRAGAASLASAMTLTLVMVFAILAALVLGFLCGRIWQIRSDELQRRASFTPPSVARIPLPRDAETNGHASASAARCRRKPDNRLDH